MKKRTLSFLLAFCLTMALLPMNVLAASTTKYELCWPLLTTASGYKTINSGLVYRTGEYAGWHRGIDINVNRATVLAAANGVVCAVDPSTTTSRGKYVAVYHESMGLLSVYQHLDSYSVEVGQSVVKGQEIAVSGNSGRSNGKGYGYHLHFELIPVSSAPKSIPWPSISNDTDLHTKYVDGDYRKSDCPIAYEWRDTPADGSGSISPYFTCNVRVNCVNGQIVPLYDAPGSSSNTGYSYNNGQSALSAQGLIRSDGTLWYQIIATIDAAAGTKRTFWLKYESGKMTVTSLMPKGPYTLTPQCAPGARLDVKGSSAADGANVQIYTANGSTAQQWELTYLNNGYYKIISKASGKALDVAGASADAGANVQQYTPNGTDAQQWMLKDAGDGYYYIVPKVNSSLCLDVAGASSADGTNVGTFTANGSGAQKWKLIGLTASASAAAAAASAASDTAASVAAVAAAASASAAAPSAARRPVTVTFNPNSGSVAQGSMTVISGTAFGTLPTPTRSGYTFDGWYTSSNGGDRMTANTVTFNTSNFTLYAHWTKTGVIPPLPDGVPDGIYTLAPLCAYGLRLDVAGADWRDNANVQIHESNGTLAQQWEVTHLGDGYYRLICMASGKALDVSQAGIESGTNVQQFAPNDTYAQQWRITNASDGTSFIIPRVNEKLFLDVSGAGNTNGTNVQIYAANGTEAQMWDLMPITLYGYD